MDVIERLCRQYTDLTGDEIQTIRGMCALLPAIANLEDADVFIDCPSTEGDAIVVAEAKPQNVPSSYKKTVVGLLAKPENEPAVARTFKLGVATKQMKAITQEKTHVIQSVEPITHHNRVIGVLICEKRMEESWTWQRGFTQSNLESGAHLMSHRMEDNSWLSECIEEGLMLIDRQENVTFCNSSARALYNRLGYVTDILGQKYENVCLVKTDELEQAGQSAVETCMGSYTISIKRIPIHTPNIAFAIIMRDVTFLREQEKQLILKSVAIQEMHHRVKNNLQTIASLLRLQTRRTEHEETKQVLVESMNRILSIAATHELLAQGGVDQVKIGEVIANIKSNAVRYFARPHFEVEISLEGDDFKVDSDIATSVALIINELLQNSLKYAFPNQNSGQIRIVVTSGELYSRIEVIDNGCGFDLQKIDRDRLGLNIVQTLVKDKLRGHLLMESGREGTYVSFDFQNQMMNRIGVT